MSSYAEAGVDVDAADRFTTSIADQVTATWGENVVGTFGGFAAGLTIPAGFKEPVLMMTTDGVGTKAELARQMGRYDGIGQDLVAMCVDDLAAQGARPLGFTDYLAVGELDRTRDRTIVESIAVACRHVGCALLGGETAVHPGVMDAAQFDLAGAALGVVERDSLLDPADVIAGHRLVGIASPNVRSNGFSLIRTLFSDRDYAEPMLGSTLGETLLEASVIYAPAALEVLDELPVTGLVHVTGGGLPGNIPRALPPGLTARIDTGTWTPPPVFTAIQERGTIEDAEMLATFNMGVGFVVITEPSAATDAISLLRDLGHESFAIGDVVEGDHVQLVR